MKTTFDLPEDLVRQLKLRAVHDGRKLKDVAAEYLRVGLMQKPNPTTARKSRIVKNRKTGLPMVQTTRRPRRELTPDELSAILTDQESAWISDA